MSQLAMLVFAAFIAGRAAAAPAPPSGPADPERSYSIFDLAALAVERSDLLESLESRGEAMDAAAEQARAWEGPRLEAAGGSKSDSAASGSTVELGVSQPLPVPGKRALRSQALRIEAEAWQARRAASAAELALAAARLGFEYGVNRRKARFLASRRERFRLLEEFLQGRPFVSPQRATERRIVRSRLRNLAAQLHREEAAYKASFERLRAYVGLEPYPEVVLPVLSTATAADRAWVDRALSFNPDLRLQELSIRGAEVERRAAEREAWPTPELNASYGRETASETERTFAVGFSLPLPFWNANRAGIRGAENRLAAERALRRFRAKEVRARTAAALADLDAARRAMGEYPPDLLGVLERELAESEEGFRRGQVDLLSFLEFESAASETYEAALETRMDFVERLVALLRLAGETDVPARLAELMEVRK